MSDLDDLRALAPPPPGAPAPADWPAARAALGTDLPHDFVELADTYGAGTFDAGVGILVPGHPNRFLDLLRQVDDQRAALRALADEDGVDLPHAPDDLIPWAIDDGGNVVWWEASGADPDRWPVVASEARGDEWLHFDGGAVAFLVAFLSGRETSDFLVVDGGGAITFERHPAAP